MVPRQSLVGAHLRVQVNDGPDLGQVLNGFDKSGERDRCPARGVCTACVLLHEFLRLQWLALAYQEAHRAVDLIVLLYPVPELAGQ